MLDGARLTYFTIFSVLMTNRFSPIGVLQSCSTTSAIEIWL